MVEKRSKHESLTRQEGKSGQRGIENHTAFLLSLPHPVLSEDTLEQLSIKLRGGCFHWDSPFWCMVVNLTIIWRTHFLWWEPTHKKNRLKYTRKRYTLLTKNKRENTSLHRIFFTTFHFMSTLACKRNRSPREELVSIQLDGGKLSKLWATFSLASLLSNCAVATLWTDWVNTGYHWSSPVTKGCNIQSTPRSTQRFLWLRVFLNSTECWSGDCYLVKERQKKAILSAWVP